MVTIDSVPPPQAPEVSDYDISSAKDVIPTRDCVTFFGM